MSVSLYRKYRPARFEDIIGQEHVARTLVNAITHDRVSHAYLFTGPRGTGKTSTAKILAMALNCDAGNGGATPTPDGTCPRCESIRRGSALDVVEMDAASNRTVEEVTETLLDKVHFAPLEGRMKVYILDEVHMLSGHAFNALLKTLEEPPAHAVFVLATTEPHKVPATILSRCQRFDFRRPSVAEVVEVLGTIARQEGIDVAEASLTVMARAAGGSFRDAIGVLDQLATYSGDAISLQQTLDILGVVQHDLLFEAVDLVDDCDTQGALLFVDRLNQAGTDYNQFMKDLLSHLRDLYVVKHTVEAPPSMALTEEQLTTLRSQAMRVSTACMLALIDLLGEGLRAIRQGSDARLELELAFIKMTAFSTDGTPRPAPRTEAATPPAGPAAAAAPSPATTAAGGAPNPPATGAAGRVGVVVRCTARHDLVLRDRRCGTAFIYPSGAGENGPQPRQRGTGPCPSAQHTRRTGPSPPCLDGGPRRGQQTPSGLGRGSGRGPRRQPRGRRAGGEVSRRLRLPSRPGDAGQKPSGHHRGPARSDRQGSARHHPVGGRGGFGSRGGGRC